MIPCLMQKCSGKLPTVVHKNERKVRGFPHMENPAVNCALLFETRENEQLILLIALLDGISSR